MTSSNATSTLRSKVESEMNVLGKPENGVNRFFQESRHTEEIIGMQEDAEERDIWRKYGKERMKTVSVALVLCLHIGVDPPDKDPRPQPCAKLQAWVDPYSCSPNKAIAKIAASLQKNYERWQPRARYKVAADPTVDEVTRLCLNLRRNAKDDRVLFHYNGHGVPRPTSNGEIWVFNKNFTQYIPLSVFDLQSWMETPSIYVWDCDSAETIVQSFNRFAGDHEKEWTVELDDYQEKMDNLPPLLSHMDLDSQAEALNFPKKRPRFRDCIQLAACRVDETLPSNPELPADLFTSCLTTPIQTSILWYLIRNNRKHEFPNVMEDIPGQLTDRRTLLGELNWIFTAITDTMAWNALPRHVFQRLFRQDLLLASLFRSFLLAERIMAANGCHVVSCPALPSTADHPLWESWEYTIDLCLAYLNSQKTCKLGLVLSVGKDFFSNTAFETPIPMIDAMSLMKHEGSSDSQYNSFFIEQLRAFEVWLEYGVEQRTPPQQLPVVLQVLLSQVHRLRALELLARFLDYGEWAVGYALSVGIFPYVLKLLQSNTKELKPWLSFIWAKILAVDPGCQAELFKENGEESRCDSISAHKEKKKELRYFYFVKMLNDPLTPPRLKVVPAFVLATLFHNNYRTAQETLTEQGYVNLCTELLSDPSVNECRLLKLWIVVGLGRLWADYNDARWQAIRLSAYKSVENVLEDESPEVRAAAVYSLGCLVRNRADRNEHALTVSHEICDSICSLCSRDGSMLVREEVLVALQYFVLDTGNMLANLHRKLVEQSGTIPTKETPEEEEVENIPVETGVEDIDRSWTSARSSRIAMSIRRKEVSESSIALEELMSLSITQLPSFQYNNSFNSADIAFREETLRLLSILEAKKFSDPFERIWVAILRLALDPTEKIARMAQVLVRYVTNIAEQKVEKSVILMGKKSTVDMPRYDTTPNRSIAPPTFDISAIEMDGDENGVEETDNACGGGVTFTVGSPQGGLMLSTTPVSSGVSPLFDTPLGPPPSTSTPKPCNGSVPKSSETFKVPYDFGVHGYLPKRRIAEKKELGERTRKEMEVEDKERRRLREVEPHALIETQFVPWCSRVFTQPILHLIQSEEEDCLNEKVLTRTNATDWAMHMEEGMRQLGEEEMNGIREKKEQMGEERVLYRRDRNTVVTSCTFSLLRPFLYTTDGEMVDMLTYEGERTANVNSFPIHAGNPFVTDKATWIEVMNATSREMLLTGSSSGIIRVWDPHFDLHSHAMDSETSLVTTAFPLYDQLRTKGDGVKGDTTLYDWNQSQGKLLCTGNVKVCRMWDAHAERKSCDIATAKKSVVVAMSTELEQSHLVALGYRNGWVQVHDCRMPSSESRILSLAEHTTPIVGIALRTDADGRNLLTAASRDGYMGIWEPRMYKEPVAEVKLVEDQSIYDKTVVSIAVHENTSLLSCALSSSQIQVYDLSGRLFTSLRSSIPNAFSRVSIQRFHPYRPLLAIAHSISGDSLISFYGPPLLSTVGKEEGRRSERRERR